MNTNQTNEASRRQSLWPLVADDTVDRVMNRLIPQAEGLIKNLFRYPHRMERSQLTNLVAVSLETNSVAVVLDYVRYQMGRDSKAETWRKGQPSFGSQLLQQLEDLRQTAGGLIEDAVRQYGIKPPDRAAEEERLWMVLVRRFVGAVHRSFVYYDAVSKERKQ